MYMVFIVYGPQVLAAFIVLGMHWDEPDVCDSGHTMRWKWWALMSAVRNPINTPISCLTMTSRLNLSFVSYVCSHSCVWHTIATTSGPGLSSTANTTTG